jgi:vacuolar-type H+-ATPase subunit F/Vma7
MLRITKTWKKNMPTQPTFRAFLKKVEQKLPIAVALVQTFLEKSLKKKLKSHHHQTQKYSFNKI